LIWVIPDSKAYFPIESVPTHHKVSPMDALISEAAEAESLSTEPDSWFRRALARREAESAGQSVVSGTRFNSAISDR